MDRIFLLLFLIHIGQLANSYEPSIFGGLEQYVNYRSSLPCEVTPKSSCIASRGLMGYALDTASQAGLNISKLIVKTEKKKPQVFAKTTAYGICLVKTNSLPQLGAISFLCSSKGIKGGQLQQVDQVLSLVKNENGEFKIENVGDLKNLKRNL